MARDGGLSVMFPRRLRPIGADRDSGAAVALRFRKRLRCTVCTDWPIDVSTARMGEKRGLESGRRINALEHLKQRSALRRRPMRLGGKAKHSDPTENDPH
jgi:hypothetical protein